MAATMLQTLLRAALSGGYAVGYFEGWDQYSVEAVLEAAEEKRSPVIIGVGGVIEQSWFDRTGLEVGAGIVRVLAGTARIPVATLLNEAKTYRQIVRGIQLGFDGVMIDTQGLPYEENVVLTRRVVDAAHAAGIFVEGELGGLPEPGPDGVIREEMSHPTDPAEAARFVAETGVDALSVAIGNVHGLVGGEAGGVDLDRLARIREVVRVPLVIHGGSGFPPSLVSQAVSLGVAKFNVGGILRRSFLTALGEAIESHDRTLRAVDVIGSRLPVDVLMAGKAAMRATVANLMDVYGSAGRANQVEARPGS